LEKSVGENKVAVILAGGEEENLRISKTQFRPTAKITDLTAVELAVKKLRESRFKQIYIVARQAVMNSIFEILGNGSKYGVNIIYLKEEKTNGTADSLRVLKGKIKSSFLVIWSDIIINDMSLDHLWQEHLNKNAVATLVATSDNTLLEKTAPMKLQGDKVTELTEKPKKAKSAIYFGGVFVAEPEILEYPGKSLEKEVFQELIKKGLLYGYVESSRHLHFHTQKDIEKVRERLKNS
jgi:NDP-sugar pyrophosphorylase family protein